MTEDLKEHTDRLCTTTFFTSCIRNSACKNKQACYYRVEECAGTCTLHIQKETQIYLNMSKNLI